MKPLGFLSLVLASLIVASARAPDTGNVGLEPEWRSPAGLSVAPDGSILVADRGAHRVYRIRAGERMVEVVAGTGAAGFSGDGGPAEEALLQNPEWVEADADGNIWIADRGNGRIRRVDAQTGLIRTVAGPDGLTQPFGLLVLSPSRILVFDTESHTIRELNAETGTLTPVIGSDGEGFSGDGGPAADARLRRPHNGVLDNQGRLVFGDSFNQRIRRVDLESGRIETIAGSGEEGPPHIGQAALASPFTFFGALAVDRSGRVLFTSLDNRILAIDSLGRLALVAGTGAEGFSGDGGPATEASIAFPYGLAVDGDGAIWFSDAGNRRIRRIGSDGIIETVVGPEF